VGFEYLRGGLEYLGAGLKYLGEVWNTWRGGRGLEYLREGGTLVKVPGKGGVEYL